VDVKVGVFGYASLEDEVVVLRPEKVPNRDRATMIGHLSAAQNGQYSAP